MRNINRNVDKADTNIYKIREIRTRTGTEMEDASEVGEE